MFDRIGIRTAVLETDAAGNFLTQGAELLSGRDWARLANLYLQDGMWDGKRILPEGFVKFVSTPAPAWVADGRNIYGGFFWLNTDGRFAVPKDAFFMAGAGGQYTFIIPSHDLVVARLGRYAGARCGGGQLEPRAGVVDGSGAGWFAQCLVTSTCPNGRHAAIHDNQKLHMSGLINFILDLDSDHYP